jgi:hypothetical protein
MNLIALPGFADNCFRMLHDGDPGEAGAVEAALEAQPVSLAAILVTPHATAALRQWKNEFR